MFPAALLFLILLIRTVTSTVGAAQRWHELNELANLFQTGLEINELFQLQQTYQGKNSNLNDKASKNMQKFYSYQI